MTSDPHDLDETRTRSLTSSSSEAAYGLSFAEGRYRVGRILGEGGQKLVYLAHDRKLDRDVVIAVLKTGRLEDERIARLDREARALARLGDHSHIVTVHDVGEEQGQPFIVTQFLDGGSLDELRRHAPDQRLPLEQVLRIADQICQALGYAHARGIVHRDLKPGNVWRTREGVFKLGDFGLAAGLDLSRVTQEGHLLGTMFYMAPEQALGRAEPRSDLYSLGVVLYELATGRLPFAGDTLAAVLSQHLHAAPVAPSAHRAELPRAFDDLILSLLAKAPGDRPASAEVVRERLLAMAEPGAPTRATGVLERDIKRLDRVAAGVFVGRSEELRALRGGFEAALAGRGQLFLLAGEPGSGKTSTAEQLLTYAHLRGAQILRGRCYEGKGAPAYWPWVQLIREYAASRSAEELAAVMKFGAPSIAELDADIAHRLPDLPPSQPLEPEQARFRLFDSITKFLKNAAAAMPLVILLDDLHWADTPSLLLLRFLAQELKSGRLLVIGTYRDLPLGRRQPLMQTLGMLAGQGLDHRIHLSGLGEADVARFIEMAAGVGPPEELVGAVYRETEGNPFFVKEVIRLLDATGQLDALGESTAWNITLPQGVREVVMRRVAQLPEEANRALAMASIVGREFDIGLLEQIGDFDPDRLLDAIEEAVAAHLVVEAGSAAERYRFSHALIRETLYETLTGVRRARLHRRVGEVMEERYRDRMDQHLAELAHHFVQAAQMDKAVDYAVRAARRADHLLAYEEAVNQYEVAIAALERGGTVPPARRCELQLALGEAQGKAGQVDQARASFVRAAGLARTADSPDLFARAALGLGGGTAARTRLGYEIDDQQIGLLREALDRAGTAETPIHAHVLAQLSLALYHKPEERAVLSERAVEIGRRVGDSAALLSTLYSRCVALEGFNAAAGRLALAREIVDIAESVGDAELALRGHVRCFRELMELGDLTSVEQALERYTGLARELGQPRYLWYVPYGRALLATFRGQFQEAEPPLQEAVTIGRRAHDPNCALFCGIVRYAALHNRGIFDEVFAMIRGIIDKYPATRQAWRLQLARLLCNMGRLDEARREYEPIAARNFDDLPIDGTYVSTLVGLSTTCWYLGDARRAEAVYRQLEPYRGTNVVAGNTGVGGGSVSAGLAGLAAAMSRWDDAERLFLEAIDHNNRMGARPWSVLAEAAYLRMLESSGRPGDKDRAAARLPDLVAASARLGMGWVVAQTDLRAIGDHRM